MVANPIKLALPAGVAFVHFSVLAGIGSALLPPCARQNFWQKQPVTGRDGGGIGGMATAAASSVTAVLQGMG